MIVALEVQRTVHDEVRIVRQQALALLPGFVRDDRRAQDEVSLVGRRIPHHEREHVGRVILAPEAAIEISRLGPAHDAYRDPRIVFEHGLRPFSHLCA